MGRSEERVSAVQICVHEPPVSAKCFMIRPVDSIYDHRYSWGFVHDRTIKLRSNCIPLSTLISFASISNCRMKGSLSFVASVEDVEDLHQPGVNWIKVSGALGTTTKTLLKWRKKNDYQVTVCPLPNSDGWIQLTHWYFGMQLCQFLPHI